MIKIIHPRPSPIAATLYTLRDMNVDVIVMHGPTGCCFRTARLLEGDGVRVVTTGMSENDFILGAGEKLVETLTEAYDAFKPKLMGIAGTCASMIIGEELLQQRTCHVQSYLSNPMVDPVKGTILLGLSWYWMRL